VGYKSVAITNKAVNSWEIDVEIEIGQISIARRPRGTIGKTNDRMREKFG